jgi:hypothetical protein
MYVCVRADEGVFGMEVCCLCTKSIGEHSLTRVGSLKDLLVKLRDSSGLSGPQTVALARDAALGLEFIHAQGGHA